MTGRPLAPYLDFDEAVVRSDEHRVAAARDGVTVGIDDIAAEPALHHGAAVLCVDDVVAGAGVEAA